MCMEREGANEDDLANVLNGTLPETRAEKCLSACLGEQYGTVSCNFFIHFILLIFYFYSLQIVNNSLSPFGFFEFVEPQINNDTQTLKLIVDIIKNCGSIYDEDACEAAAKIFECIDNLTKLC